MVPAVAGEHSGERPAAGTPNAEALVGSPLRLGATCDTLVAAAAAEGFVVAATGPNRFRMAKSWRPRWARVLMWLLLPVAGLGLVFLLIRRSATLDASVDEQRRGVEVRIQGVGASRLAEVLTGLLHSGHDGVPARAEEAPGLSVVPRPPTAPGVSAGDGLAIIAATPLSASAAAASTAHEPDVEQTVAASRARHMPPAPPQPRPAAVLFPDGRQVVLDRVLVLGRDPLDDGRYPGTRCLPLTDASVSKTHAAIGPSGAGAWVVDGHSTNGTAVVSGTGSRACTPGVRVEVPLGATVMPGSLALRVVNG